MMSARRRARIFAIAAAVAIIATAAGAVALTSSNSRELSQSSAGVNGTAETGDFFAAAVAVGDFNNDGYGDVIAGSPYEDLRSKVDGGQIQVFYGTASGVTTVGDRTIHQGTRRVVGTSEPDDLFGSALAVGDFDFDGYDDLAVGVPGEDVHATVDAGAVTILYGGEFGLSGQDSQVFSQASTGVEGDVGAYDNFGHSLVVGRFNDDAYDDLAIGAPGDGEAGAARSGSVNIVYGSANGIVIGSGGLFLTQEVIDVAETAEIDDSFGWSLAAGNFNGDQAENGNGLDDLAVGVPGETHEGLSGAGIVQIFLGSPAGVVIDGNMIISESTPSVRGLAEANDRVGTSLAAGDIDGDGYDDLAIGAPGEARKLRLASGLVIVLEGSPIGLTGILSRRLSQYGRKVPGVVEAGDEFGFSVVIADFNNNGRADLAVGVPGEGVGSINGAGVVHTFFGGSSRIKKAGSQMWQPGVGGVPGSPNANAGVGRALAAGDVNGDGRDDLVIASPGRTVSGRATSGSFIIVYG